MRAAPVPLPSRRRDWLAAAALAAVTLIVFSPALGCEFVNFDDYTYVERNPNVTGGLTAAGMRWAFTTFRTANWHPLTWLSLQLDASLFGPHAWAFHLTNVVFHAANAALVFLALRALTDSFWRSAAVALLFAVHPLRVESVAWVAERKDVLSVFFGLLALWAYAHYARRPSAILYCAIAGALALSLLCKPMLVTLPFLLLVLDWWPLARARTVRAWGWRVIEKLPLFALVAASSVMSYRAQSAEGAVQGLEDFPPSARVANAVISYGVYLAKTAWPVGLAAFYPHPGTAWSLARALGSAVLLAALTAGALVLRRRAPYLLAGWLWYLGTLVPVIGLVQVGNQAMADRYSYFPQIGVLIALCWGVADLARVRGRLTAAAAGAGAAALVLAILTVIQIDVWHDSLSLWRHALAVTGESATVAGNLAETLEEHKQLAEAVPYYREAVRLAPNSIQARTNLGNALRSLGKLDDAAEEYAAICRLTPDSPVGYTQLGLLYLRQHKLKEAADQFEKSWRLEPDRVDGVLNRALVEEERDDFDKAAEFYRQALALQPDSPHAHAGLGVALLHLHRDKEGLDQLRQAVKCDPDFEKGHTLLGKALLTRNDPEGAAVHFTEATRIKPDQASGWLGLGLALQRLGQSERAASCFAKAKALGGGP
jgi:tetratricopeptide (TPR) repeat protein